MKRAALDTAETNRATRKTASVFGVLVGLAGIEHGLFEILQGNMRPQQILIAAIGPAQRFWQYGTETALSVVPNFFVTGVLAVLIGLLVVIWAAAFVQKRSGPWALLLLSVLLFLVGGGFAPVFLSLLAVIMATRIKSPLRFWRSHLPAGVRRVFAGLYPGALGALVVIFCIAVEIAIFGYPLLWLFDADTTFIIQNTLAYIMVALMSISLFAAFARDAHMKSG